MRIKVEIPEHTRLRLLEKAKAEDSTVNKLIVKALENFLAKRRPKPRRVKIPIISSKRPGTLYLDNEKIFKIIDFP